mgnify:CR=1 FL=1
MLGPYPSTGGHRDSRGGCCGRDKLLSVQLAGSGPRGPGKSWQNRALLFVLLYQQSSLIVIVTIWLLLESIQLRTHPKMRTILCTFSCSCSCSCNCAYSSCLFLPSSSSSSTSPSSPFSFEFDFFCYTKISFLNIAIFINIL